MIAAKAELTGCRQVEEEGAGPPRPRRQGGREGARGQVRPTKAAVAKSEGRAREGCGETHRRDGAGEEDGLTASLPRDAPAVKRGAASQPDGRSSRFPTAPIYRENGGVVRRDAPVRMPKTTEPRRRRGHRPALQGRDPGLHGPRGRPHRGGQGLGGQEPQARSGARLQHQGIRPRRAEAHAARARRGGRRSSAVAPRSVDKRRRPMPCPPWWWPTSCRATATATSSPSRPNGRPSRARPAHPRPRPEAGAAPAVRCRASASGRSFALEPTVDAGSRTSPALTGRVIKMIARERARLLGVVRDLGRARRRASRPSTRRTPPRNISCPTEERGGAEDGELVAIEPTSAASACWAFRP